MRKKTSITTLILSILFLFSIKINSYGTDLKVTNNSDIINGNTSSPTALINFPGPDGISLREAILATNSAPGPHLITFDSSLKGTMILLSDVLPTITQGLLVINGDIDADSVPDISIESTGANSNICFRISASDVAINGFAIINFPSFGIEVATKQNGNGINVFEKVIITNNEIRGSYAGISVSNFEHSCSIKDIEIKQNYIHDNSFTGIQIHAGYKQLSSYNSIINIKVINNILTRNVIAIYAQGGTSEGSNNNTISNLLISENRISDHSNVFLLISGGCGLGVQNNKIEGLIISNNICENNSYPMEIVGASQVGDDGELPNFPDEYSKDVTGNSVSNVKIFGNFIRGGGIQFSCAYASKKWPELISRGNIISDVNIGLNIIANCDYNGILLVSGSSGAKENTIKNIIIHNNLIVKNYNGGGIVLTCGYENSPSNIIDDIEIVNNTISECGIYQKPPYVWAGGIVLNANNQSILNQIYNVKIKNNILWHNASNDFITGTEAALCSVSYSLINDSRFKKLNNNFYEPPDFVNPENMNYQLLASSSCIDRGDTSTMNIGNVDLAGKNRYVDALNNGEAIIDVGAYEYQQLIITQIHDIVSPIPLNLFQNYPNPFNQSTTISYSIPLGGKTILKVFDIFGNEIEILVNEEMIAGKHEVKFNRCKLPNGIYFYKMQFGNSVIIKKMLLN